MNRDQAVDCLLNAFDYQNNHRCDLESVLYLKAIFIRNNGLPQSKDKRRIALRLLAADCGMLFKDGDGWYRNRHVNAVFLSQRRALRRNRHGKVGQENLIHQTLSVCTSETDSYAKLSESLLREIVHDAAQKRRSVYDWLYST